MTYRPNSLLLIIPSVLDKVDDELVVDVDFAHNLRAYLERFAEVCVMCPLTSTSLTFPETIPIRAIAGHDRLSFDILPEPYREDKYLRARRQVSAAMRDRIRSHEFILLSPHAAFDWSTLAGSICRQEGIPYNMEADWSLPQARRQLLKKMPWGFSKARKWAWYTIHDRSYYQVLRASSLALLQGGDVFHDLAPHATNPYSVLNVQVGADEHITHEELLRKTDAIYSGHPIEIIYAGRASEMKGPYHWLDAVTMLKEKGHHFHATWIGDGEDLTGMKKAVQERGLSGCCSLPGKMSREDTRCLVKAANIFMFCHLIKESPRCLVEALAFGTPIIGFEGYYAKGLVEKSGGGIFVGVGDTENLADEIARLLQSPSDLRSLTIEAAATGRGLERDAAINHRIDLMYKHVHRQPNSNPNKG